MAEDKMEIWSWNEAFPGFDIENATGIPRGELEKIFGTYDIKVQVPDKNSFLNETDLADNPDKFESERKVLTKFLNSLRAQMNITERPFNSYSEEELDQIQLKQRYLNEVKQEQALASDPMKVMNAQWRQKLDDDKRNFHTFLTERDDKKDLKDQAKVSGEQSRECTRATGTKRHGSSSETISAIPLWGLPIRLCA